jgi:DNA-binding NarL/FixJ family response regulator
MADRGKTAEQQEFRVLVVEDDPSWQQILGEILTDLGAQVDLASSYTQAVEMMRKEPHRLAILDLSLGGTDHHNQDGIRVAEAVLRHDPGCTVLFLTGFATVELAVRVMRELNALTCLRKETFRRSEFRQVINDALSQAPLVQADETEEDRPAGRGIPRAASREAKPVSGEPGLALVVEDDAGWRSLLAEILGDEGYRVRTSSSYVEAISFLKRDDVQVAVVDLSLASSLAQDNLDGYRLLTSMQKARVPVIVVSGYAEPARIEQAFRDRLIYACLEKQAFDRKSFRLVVERARTAAEEDPVIRSLTEREREVLVLLARGLTNKEIARDLIITPNTVKRHLKSLFAKLDVSTRSAASAKAISMGLDQD